MKMKLTTYTCLLLLTLVMPPLTTHAWTEQVLVNRSFEEGGTAAAYWSGNGNNRAESNAHDGDASIKFTISGRLIYQSVDVDSDELIYYRVYFKLGDITITIFYDASASSSQFCDYTGTTEYQLCSISGGFPNNDYTDRIEIKSSESKTIYVDYATLLIGNIL